MGNCLSTPSVSDGVQKPAAHRPGPHYKAGKAAHDSVHSLDTAAAKDAAPGWSSSGKQASHKQQQQERQQSQKLSGGTTASSRQTSGKLSSAGSTPAKQRKPPGIDLATGKTIPDFNVNGVLDVLHELGSGGSGTTYLCREQATAKLVAVKFVPRPLPKAAVPLMMAEVELQAQLGEGHVNIITMRELLLTRTHLGLAMDYASGGALTHRVSDLWESALTRGGLHMDEQEACYYLRQFISAMDYLHKHKVAHRDLKLDNTLLEDGSSGPAYVRICDFGFAKAWTTSDNMKTAIGTPVYMSPQMLAAKQCTSGYSGVKADMWAAGVLLFVMLLGAFPFDHAENLDPNSRQASNEVWLRQQAPGGWRKHPLAIEALSRQVLSPDCCALLDGLLEMDEERRFSTREVLSHPWMQQTLLPDQQRAWEQLQGEQEAVTQDIALKSDVYKVRLRKQALNAMLAFAAKPPGRTSLLPQPSMSGAHPAAAAAAAAAADQQQQEGHGPTPAAAGAAGERVPLPGGVAVSGVSKVSAPGSAPNTPLAAAAAGPPSPAAAWGRSESLTEGPGPRTDSIPESQPVNLPAPSTPSASSAAAAAAAAAAAPAGGVSDVEAFRVSSSAASSLPDSDRTQHISFQAGEGLRSDSLEAKVEAYRQQLADLRAARIATAAQQQETAASPTGGAPNGSSGAAVTAAAAGSGCSSRVVSPFVAAAGAAATAVTADGSSSGVNGKQQQVLSPLLSPNESAAASPTPGSPTNRSSQQQQQQQRGGSSMGAAGSSSSSSKGSKFKKMFSGAGSKKAKSVGAGGGGAGKGGGLFDVEDDWDDTPDEVWRIPLTSTADPAAYKLSPELTVAAGALACQLQKNGKIEGRGRTNRSSCPVYSG